MLIVVMFPHPYQTVEAITSGIKAHIREIIQHIGSVSGTQTLFLHPLQGEEAKREQNGGTPPAPSVYGM